VRHAYKRKALPTVITDLRPIRIASIEAFLSGAVARTLLGGTTAHVTHVLASPVPCCTSKSGWESLTYKEEPLSSASARS
jgi:hypothetical protein